MNMTTQDTSVAAPRRRMALATGIAMATLVGGLLVAAPAAAAPAAVSSDSILRANALDNRMADDGTTPIAVKGGTSADGSTIVYGARPDPAPTSANLNTRPTGTRYFVDCSQAVSGTGTAQSPLNSIAAANALALQPGDELLFKRGVACAGMLQPTGSGTAHAPVVIDSYGNAASMARIDGDGAPQAVLLSNVQHYVVRNLELTDQTNDSRDLAPGSERRGIAVELTDFGTGTGYDLEGLYIHDVLGAPTKDLGGSGGIQFEVYGSKTQTKFAGVNVEYNTIRHVNRSGINMSSSWWSRPEVKGNPPYNYYPWDAMSIHDNFLTDIGGDGIVVQYAPGSTVDHNTVEDAASNLGRDTLNSANAAVWAWNADHVTFSYNHVFDTQRHPDDNDGEAFDSDYGTTGSVFEHNLSHDNQGGFLLFCGCWGISSKTQVRYNISLNDGRNVPVNRGSGAARVFFMGGQDDGEVYNNTILLAPTTVDIAYDDDYLADQTSLVNNIFIAQPGTTVTESADAAPGNVLTWRNNLFGGTSQGWPQPSTNTINPALTLSPGRGLQQLQIRTSQTLHRGIPIAPQSTTDIRGTTVPWTTSPDLGAYQFTPVLPASQTTVDNGGFELGSLGWHTRGASITPLRPESGRFALAFVSPKGTAQQTLQLAINRTYRLIAAFRTPSHGRTGTVQVILPSGAVVTAKPTGGVDKHGFQTVTAVFRTAEDATNATLQIAGGRGLAVDNITLTPTADLMVDGSFESLFNTVWQADNTDTTDALPRSTNAVSGHASAAISTATPAQNPYTYVAAGTSYELEVFAKADAGETVTLSWKNSAGETQSTTTSSTEWLQISVPIDSQTSQITVSCSGNGLCDDMTLTSPGRSSGA